MTPPNLPSMNNKVRLTSNYLRLGVTFVSGLAIVRMLAEVGTSTLNIYLILLAGTGFAFFMKIVMQESVIPLLGLSFEGQGGRDFARVYWTSFIFAVISSLFAIVVFLGLWLAREHFNLGALPAYVLGISLATGAFKTVFASLATPPLQAILISGNIISYNVFLSLERLVDLVVLAVLLGFLSNLSEEKLASIFFIISAALHCILHVVIFFFSKRLDPRFFLKPVVLTQEDFRWTRGIIGWNIGIVVAFLLYLRFSTIAVNISFGETPTLILGLVYLLIGYQRQVSMGLVVGLDAIVARTAGSRAVKSTRKVETQLIILRSSYVQSVFSFGSVILMWLLADAIFGFWIGDSLSESGWDQELAVSLFRIMSIGVLARSLSENWMKILNGQGLVGKYAPWLVAGSLAYAVIMLYWLFSKVDPTQVLTWLAMAFAFLYTIVHLFVIPEVLCYSFELSRLRLLRTATAPGLIILLVAIVSWHLGSLAVCITATVSTSLLLLAPQGRRSVGGLE